MTFDGFVDKAIAFIQKQLNIVLEIGDRAGEGRAYGNLGVAYNDLGQFANCPKPQ